MSAIAPLPEDAALDQLPEDRPNPQPLPATAPPSDEDELDIVAIGTFRRRFGYALALFTMLGLLATFGWSLYALDHLLPGATAFDLSRLGAHGLITLALVWALYQLLRMAERLILPANLLARAEILLGNQPDFPASKLGELLLQALQSKKRDDAQE